MTTTRVPKTHPNPTAAPSAQPLVPPSAAPSPMRAAYPAPTSANTGPAGAGPAPGRRMGPRAAS